MKEAKSKPVDSIIESYTAGHLYKVWKSQRDTGLWPRELALIQAHCPDHEMAICNVGCGAGRETFGLYGLGYRNVCGIDGTQTLIDAAHNRCREEGLDIRFDCATADNLPCPDSSIDVITMFANLYGHITPHAARLEALREARRVLKPGGVILMTATSIRRSVLCFIYVNTQSLWRCLYNPRAMEWGDKLTNRKHWPAGATSHTAPCTHWFFPEEIPADARSVKLEVVQRSTTHAIVKDSTSDSRHYHGQGRLVYVLRRGSE